MSPRVYLRNLAEVLRTSYWPIPAATMLASVLLALAAIRIDRTHAPALPEIMQWGFVTDPAGARNLLSTVAGSMITVAGVVFSITIVVLTLASNQYGPRLLRSFIRDRANRAVLGCFVATFLYCLLVLGAVRDGGAEAFVPQVAVALSLLVTIASLGVLVFYIHHVATGIQAEYVIHSVQRELHDAIERLMPAEAVPGPGDRPLDLPPPDYLVHSAPVTVSQAGYLQALDTERLVQVAEDEGVVITCLVSPGRYLVTETPVAMVWPASHVAADLATKINAALVVGSRQTPEEDLELPIRELVEVAVRALSPGVNDPFTALSCIDVLAEGLATAAVRDFASPFHHHANGKLRLITDPVRFEDLLDAALDPLRQYGCGTTPVALRLLDAIALVSYRVRRDRDRAVLRRHARLVAEVASGCLRDQVDREAVAARHEAVEALFEKARSRPDKAAGAR